MRSIETAPCLRYAALPKKQVYNTAYATSRRSISSISRAVSVRSVSGHPDSRHQAFYQLLQVAPEGMLRGIAEFIALVDVYNVLV